MLGFCKILKYNKETLTLVKFSFLPVLSLLLPLTATNPQPSSLCSSFRPAIASLFLLPASHRLSLPPLPSDDQPEGHEAALKRPGKRDEVWKKTHTKSKVGKKAWVEPQAEEAYNQYKKALEELARSQPTEEQGQSIMPSEEETLPFWLNVVGGVYKGRAYGLSSERNYHRLECGLQGIGTVQSEDLEEIGE
nr:uncharacterized protein LOC104086496 [Nicotiana tomentosiformis]